MRQVFGAEFKREAIRLALTSGLTQERVATDLGIGKSTLAKWIQADARIAGSGANDAQADVDLLKENERLRQADLARAVSQKLGLSTDRLGQVHRCDEGRIVGHVTTALGQFTIADRGVGLMAFKSTLGLELSVGLELGGGLER